MRRTVLQLLFLFILPFLAACSGQRKVTALQKDAVSAGLEISDAGPQRGEFFHATPKDTLMVSDLEGNEVYIMKAVRDEDGEMVATDVLEAAKVTARFRNVAERNGKVDLRFRIIVPGSMMDSKCS